MTPIKSASAMNRRLTLRLICLASIAMFQGGCVQLAEVDSTHSPRYASMIGRTFELREEFLVYGVKRPDQRSSEPDYILVMPPPGIGGHLILDLGRAPAGSRFKIVGVVTHRSKLFPSTRYVIAFVDHSIGRAADKKIMINDVPAWKLYNKPISPDEAPSLSGRYFRPLESERK